MNAVVVSKIKTQQCLYCTGPVQYRASTRTATRQVDLFGVPIQEKPFREKRLGYLSKVELIERVRKIFPNAKVLPNTKSSAYGAPHVAWSQTQP